MSDASKYLLFFDIVAIPRFTSNETVQSVLLLLKDLVLERKNWGLATELFPDSHYSQWILLRKNAWSILDFLSNTIELNLMYTFSEWLRWKQNARDCY